MLIAQSSSGVATASAFVRTHRGAEVFVETDGDRSLAIVAAAADAPGWTVTPVELLFSQGLTGAQAGEWLFCVGLWVPSENRDDFLKWYEREHLPILLECATWDGCRFVEAPVPRGCQFYSLHQLADREALTSPQRARSRDTPWFHRLKRYDWFDESFTRTLYRRLEIDR
jgi:hypothetical protein